MNTTAQRISLETALSDLPSPLLNKLVKNYSTLKHQALGSLHDTVGHQAGKLAEVLLRIVQHLLLGTYTPLTQDIGNFKNECDKIEKSPAQPGLDSLRVIIPRVLLVLYTFRNKRDFGHAGGEVDANEIDAFTVSRLADWCMCELVRICHQLPLEDAQLLCNAIAERRLPKLWNVMGKKRVLDTALSYRDQTLLILYSDIQAGIATEDLFAWTEHSHRATYRRSVLGSLHDDRLIEWDRELEMAVISPTGIEMVERQILASAEKGSFQP